MKLSDFLKEDINFAPLYEPFYRTVTASCYRKIFQIVKMFIRNNVRDLLEYENEITSVLQDDLTNTLTIFLNTHITNDYKIGWRKFKSTSTNGVYDSANKYIFINRPLLTEYLNSTTDMIVHMVSDYYINNAVQPKVKIDLNSNQLNKIKEEVEWEFRHIVTKLCTNLIKIFFHEITHQQQHNRSDDKELFNRYTSYLEKNKRKLNKALENLGNSENYKIYRASPQEIDAFAKTVVASYVKMFVDAIDDEPNDRDKYDAVIFFLKDMIKYFRFEFNTNDIVKYYKDTFSDNNKKIYRRFVKKLFQEFNNILEYYKEKNKYWGK